MLHAKRRDKDLCNVADEMHDILFEHHLGAAHTSAILAILVKEVTTTAELDLVLDNRDRFRDFLSQSKTAIRRHISEGHMRRMCESAMLPEEAVLECSWLLRGASTNELHEAESDPLSFIGGLPLASPRLKAQLIMAKQSHRVQRLLEQFEPETIHVKVDESTLLPKAWEEKLEEKIREFTQDQSDQVKSPQC